MIAPLVQLEALAHLRLSLIMGWACNPLHRVKNQWTAQKRGVVCHGHTAKSLIATLSRSHIEQRRQNHVFANYRRESHIKNGNARSFGLIALRTPRLPRFTFCATAEIET